MKRSKTNIRPIRYIQGHTAKFAIVKKDLPHEKKVDGYIYIRKPNHPHTSLFGGYVMRCRLVMEEHLGKFLTPDEMIVHINGIKTDDRLENLLLFANKKEYGKYRQSCITARRKQNRPHEKKWLGHVYIFTSNHPYPVGGNTRKGGKKSGGYVRRSRLVIETHLGRFLKPEERVFHINGITDDDRLENLKLVPNQKEYDKYYHLLNLEKRHKQHRVWNQKNPGWSKQRKRKKALERFAEHAAWLAENWQKVYAVLFAWNYLRYETRLENAKKRNLTRIPIGRGNHMHIPGFRRKGVCSQCGGYDLFRGTKTTGLYSVNGRFMIFPWFGLVELCHACAHPITTKKKRESFITRVGIGPNGKRQCCTCGSRYTQYTIRENYTLTPAWSRCKDVGCGGWLCKTCYSHKYDKRTPYLRMATNEWYISQILRAIESKEREILNKYSGGWDADNAPGVKLNS